MQVYFIKKLLKDLKKYFGLNWYKPYVLISILMKNKNQSCGGLMIWNFSQKYNIQESYAQNIVTADVRPRTVRTINKKIQNVILKKEHKILELGKQNLAANDVDKFDVII